jgi:DNA-directed RNA polymerase subunit RPC12/RpoP
MGLENQLQEDRAMSAEVCGPCGHLVDFEESCIARDEFNCPVCGLQWGVDQEPPTVLPNGFIMPGKRTVVTRKQNKRRGNLRELKGKI